MPPQYKMCQKCQTPAALDAQSCARCGHVYRTQFVPPQVMPQLPWEFSAPTDLAALNPKIAKPQVKWHLIFVTLVVLYGISFLLHWHMEKQFAEKQAADDTEIKPGHRFSKAQKREMDEQGVVGEIWSSDGHIRQYSDGTWRQVPVDESIERVHISADGKVHSVPN